MQLEIEGELFLAASDILTSATCGLRSGQAADATVSAAQLQARHGIPETVCDSYHSASPRRP